MSPIRRDYLLYGAAVLIGFGAYLLAERLFRLDFAIALLIGFVAIHGALLLGRRLF